MLCNLKEASDLVSTGRPLLIAGNAGALRKLPRGNWMGGTTPYLMAGGKSGESGDGLLVTCMPDGAEFLEIQRYGVGGVGYVLSDSPSEGFTVVVMPLGAEVQQYFSKEANGVKGLLEKTIVGWISGVVGNRLNERPQVFYGPTGHGIEDEIVAMHVKLPAHLAPCVDVINIFEEGDGDSIAFVSDGFTATYAIVNGESVSFAKYLAEQRINLSLPLVTTVNGRRYNVSLGGYDTDSGRVNFYAPVFHDIVYKFARPVADPLQALRNALPANDDSVVFGCLCTGNYMDGALADYSGNRFEGPVSYGEIAYLMTNQCIVRLRITKRV